MRIQFITTGGTIDKIYFDSLSKFEVGDPQIKTILTDALVDFDYDVVALMKKDSLEMTDEDRQAIRSHIENDDGRYYVVTHGTDTMSVTAEALEGLEDKTIVLTGALTPARFRTTDAVFNVGMAVAAVQAAEPGVYIVMSGQVFEAGHVRKNRAEKRQGGPAHAPRSRLRAARSRRPGDTKCDRVCPGAGFAQRLTNCGLAGRLGGA
jgi:L-asparaginase